MFTDDVHSKYEILNHLYFGPNFVFGGLLSGIQVLFLIFCRRPTIVAHIFTQPYPTALITSAFCRALHYWNTKKIGKIENVYSMQILLYYNSPK